MNNIEEDLYKQFDKLVILSIDKLKSSKIIQNSLKDPYERINHELKKVIISYISLIQHYKQQEDDYKDE